MEHKLPIIGKLFFETLKESRAVAADIIKREFESNGSQSFCQAVGVKLQCPGLDAGHEIDTGLCSHERIVIANLKYPT